MAYRDDGFGAGGAAAADELAAAVVAELASDACLGGVRLRSHCVWSTLGLVQAALFWAWPSNAYVVDRFAKPARPPEPSTASPARPS